ncbi:hypothetical protein OS035_32085 [Rhizobium sp. 268]
MNDGVRRDAAKGSFDKHLTDAKSSKLRRDRKPADWVFRFAAAYQNSSYESCGPCICSCAEGPLLGDLPDENGIQAWHGAEQRDNVLSQPQPWLRRHAFTPGHSR